MAQTREFKEIVQARAERDLMFRKELLREGVECLLAGDVDTANVPTVLRNHIVASIGFKKLGKLTRRQPKSLMRMFGPNGNPRARSLYEVIGCLQQHEGLHLRVHAVR